MEVMISIQDGTAGSTDRLSLNLSAGALLGPRSWGASRAGNVALRRRRGPGWGGDGFCYAWRVYPSHPTGHYMNHGPPPPPPPQIYPNARGRCHADSPELRSWSVRVHWLRGGLVGVRQMRVGGRVGGKVGVAARAPIRHPNLPLGVR